MLLYEIPVKFICMVFSVCLNFNSPGIDLTVLFTRNSEI